MANVFCKQINKDSNWFNNVWFKDEAYFYLDNRINSQNSRTWVRRKPDAMNERPLHSQKCTAWCAMSAPGIIGPLSIEKSGHAVPVNQERYRETIRDFCEILNRRSGLDVENQWLMQDRALPHTANATMSALRETFNDHLILKTNFAWAPSSPDMNLFDFSL